ncbi:MAG: S41 family peptidase, partial [Rhodospirillales bacterium]
TIMPLPGHGAMRLTTARYYTPSGRSIQGKGIEPDIEVKQAKIELVDTPQRRREADLRNALDNGDKDGSEKTGADKSGATTPGDKPGDAKTKPEKPAAQDYQLARALDLLRGLSLFSGKTVTTTN